jgi:hypothetical protein
MGDDEIQRQGRRMDWYTRIACVATWSWLSRGMAGHWWENCSYDPSQPKFADPSLARVREATADDAVCYKNDRSVSSRWSAKSIH